MGVYRCYGRLFCFCSVDSKPFLSGGVGDPASAEIKIVLRAKKAGVLIPAFDYSLFTLLLRLLRAFPVFQAISFFDGRPCQGFSFALRCRRSKCEVRALLPI